ALPDAVPPLAAAPFTVTLAMPLPPVPLSVAVPASTMLGVFTAWPFVWLVIERVGGAVSGCEEVMVIEDVRALPAPLVAMTVGRLEPPTSVTARRSSAVAAPVAVPPVAAAPFTVTLEMPLLPVPLSVAVPDSVMLAVLTVWPFVWLVIDSVGGIVSDD